MEWAPYVVPYLGFLAVAEIQMRAPGGVAAYLYPIRLGVPLALLLFYGARGSFPELAHFRPKLPVLSADVGCGLVVAGVWSAPYLLGILPGPRATFDPDALGRSVRGLLLAVRFVSFVVVTPFIEELFIRSFVMRLVDVVETHGDFRAVPIGRFTWRSFLITTAVFTVSHATWQWPVAALTGAAYNGWLYHRRHLGAVVLAHAVTNCSLFTVALLADTVGRSGGLWFLL